MSGFRKRHWVIVATQIDKPCFDYYSNTTDTCRVARSDYSDLFQEVQKHWAKGEAIGTLGVTADRWAVTFVRGGLRRGGSQSMVHCSSYSELRQKWRVKNGVITQLACKNGEILAVFGDMYDGEKAGLFSVELTSGLLKGSDLQDAADRSQRNVIAAAYFERDDRWIFVLSSHGSCAERWVVRETFDPQYIRDGYSDGYLIRCIVASPSQWFILMQKNHNSKSIQQTVHHTMDEDVQGFLQSKWNDDFNITAFTGNACPQSGGGGGGASGGNALALVGAMAMLAAAFKNDDSD